MPKGPRAGWLEASWASERNRSHRHLVVRHHQPSTPHTHPTPLKLSNWWLNTIWGKKLPTSRPLPNLPFSNSLLTTQTKTTSKNHDHAAKKAHATGKQQHCDQLHSGIADERHGCFWHHCKHCCCQQQRQRPRRRVRYATPPPKSRSPLVHFPFQVLHTLI